MPIERIRSEIEAVVLHDASPMAAVDRNAGLQKFVPRLADGFVYKSISEATRRTYRKAIKDFFAYVNFIHPAQVTAKHVISYRDHMIAKKKSTNTINLRISVIRSFFDYMVADGQIERNPASTKLVSTPPVSTTPSGRALTPKEVRYLLAGPDRSTPDGARDYALMLLMLRLSLRVAEACSARRSDIKWSHGRSVITKLLNDGRSYREVQMVTKQRDPRSVQRYDHGRENLEKNPVNSLNYDDYGDNLPDAN